MAAGAAVAAIHSVTEMARPGAKKNLQRLKKPVRAPRSKVNKVGRSLLLQKRPNGTPQRKATAAAHNVDATKPLPPVTAVGEKRSRVNDDEGEPRDIAMADRGKRSRASNALVSRPVQLKRVRNREQRRQRVIDEWDSGAQERLEASGLREKNIGMEFKPKPATFTGEAEETKVRRLGAQMGDLAGPLLVSLWEADRDLASTAAPVQAVTQLATKYRVQQDAAELRAANRFAALASSDSEDAEDNEQEPEEVWVRPATLNRPGKLTAPVVPVAKPLFAPATFTAPPLSKAPPRNVVEPPAPPQSSSSSSDDDESL